MAGMAAACSSGVMFRARELGSNGASLFQYRGLRTGENRKQGNPGKCQSFSNNVCYESMKVY